MTRRTHLPEQRANLGAQHPSAAAADPRRDGASPSRVALPSQQASRHSVGHYGGLHPEDVPHFSEGLRPLPLPAPAKRGTSASRAQPPAVAPAAREEDEDWRYQSRAPSNVRKYQVDLETSRQGGAFSSQGLPVVLVHRQRQQGTPPPRATTTAAQAPPPPNDEPRGTKLSPRVRPRRRGWWPGWGRMHWLWYVGLGMLLLLLGWTGVHAFLSWWQVTQDDWHYGRPRTFQIDAVVGHHDSAAHPSHFVAINLHGTCEIIELPGGDASHAIIYQGPPLIGDGQEDLAPITLSFQDVNGDGKPDMLFHIGNQVFVFLNDTVGGVPRFRPLKPGEHVTVPLTQ